MKFGIFLILFCFGIHLITSNEERGERCYKEILDVLPIEYLIKEGLKSEDCRILAYMRFKDKTYERIITLANRTGQDSDGVFIEKGLAIDFLKAFGSHYSDLILDCRGMEKSACTQISEYMPKCCNDTLHGLQIGFVFSSAFKHSQPLHYVKSLIVNDYMDDELFDPTIKFPGLRYLTMNEYKDNGSYDRKYPHLVHFQASIFYSRKYSTEKPTDSEIAYTRIK